MSGPLALWAPPLEATMKDLRCLFGWHRFITTHSEDGTGVSAECARCGKYMPDTRVAGGWSGS